MQMAKVSHGRKTVVAAIVVCLVLWPLHVRPQGYCTKDVCSLTFSRDPSFDAVMSTRANTSTLEGMSRIQCGDLCGRFRWCSSFFHHSAYRQCRLQRYSFVDGQFETVPDAGWRHYKIDGGACPWQDHYVIDRLSSTCFQPVRNPYHYLYRGTKDCKDKGGRLTVLDRTDKLEFLLGYMAANHGYYGRGSFNYNIGLYRNKDDRGTPYTYETGLKWQEDGPLLDLNVTTGQYWKRGGFTPCDTCDTVVLDRRNGYKLMPRTDSRRHYICEKAYTG